MSGHWTIATPDGDMSAYVARPSGPGPWPGVVAIQEIFGVNEVMRETCDTLAEQGYLAVCPDLFWRLEPGVDITDKSQAEWDKALDLMGRFDVDKGVEDIRATIDQLRGHPDCTGKVGAVGFCLGGRLAFLTALRTDADVSVGYYAVGLDRMVDEAGGLSGPLMLHIAEEDGFVSKDAQAAIIGALKDNPAAVIHTYPGRDHAFARPGGAHHHHEDAALANARTLAFLAANLA
jgi:carboxymethylenebutenolidase